MTAIKAAMLLRVVGVSLAAAALRALVVSIVSVEALHADVHGVAAYLEVTGAVYSIVVAFLMYVVWDQFNRVQMGLIHEAAGLEDLGRVATFLSERDSASVIRRTARQYIRDTVGDEPVRLADGQVSVVATESFSALCKAVRETDMKTEKDRVVYEELLDALRRVADARADRLAVSATRIPGTLWNVVVMGMALLVCGFLVLGVQSFALGIGMASAVAGGLTFLLGVIRDIDNPFRGIWTVSYGPLTAASVRLA